MRRIGRFLLWALLVVLVLVLVLAGSVAVEGFLGPRRVAALSNTVIPGSSGPDVRAYVARPQTPGPHPAVVMVHEWWGLKPEMIGKADALAAEGYVVVAPDVLRGNSTGWFARAIWQVSTTPTTQIDGDMRVVLDWLSTQPDVAADRIAVMGFCFGGGVALRYSLGDDRPAATAVFYGTLVTDPQRLRSLPGPLLGVFGSADQQIPVAEVQAFDAALDQAGIPNEITIYDGQPHAFVKSIEEIRQGGPQGEAWAELLAFLRGTIAMSNEQ